MTKVSAATITKITAESACRDLSSLSSSFSVTPTVAEILAQWRQDDPERGAVLDRLAAKMPYGFALAPVLYTRLDSAPKASVDAEYTFAARRRFITYLGTTQQQALRDLGICDHGISRMARGLDPATVTGDRYALNVDHIIERGGSGRLSDGRAIDPLAPAGTAASYPVNHIGNMILLPLDIHDLKNTLNGVQDTAQMRKGESRWIVMLTPVVDAKHAGFVCPPQPPGRKLGRLQRYSPTPHNQIGDISRWNEETMLLMRSLEEKTAIGPLLDALEKKAEEYRPREQRPANDDVVAPRQRIRQPYNVADLADAVPHGWHARKRNQAPLAKTTLRAQFDAAAAREPKLRSRVDEDLRPRFRDIAAMLRKVHHRVDVLEAARPGHSFYRDFVKFHDGQALRNTVLAAARYPVPEARALLDEYRRIGRALGQRSDRSYRGKPNRKAG